MPDQTDGAEPRQFRVGVRVLLEGFVEVKSSGPRSARAQALALVGGPDPLAHLTDATPIAHDAVPHKDIKEIA